MTSRQHRILRVFTSLAVGAMAFLITFPVVLLLGGILLGPLERDVLMPAQVIVLLLISTLMGLIIAVFVGGKYYWYMGKKE